MLSAKDFTAQLAELERAKSIELDSQGHDFDSQPQFQELHFRSSSPLCPKFYNSDTRKFTFINMDLTRYTHTIHRKTDTEKDE